MSSSKPSQSKLAGEMAASQAVAGKARRERRTFTDEFKQSAVRLVVSEGYSFAAAADAVGVGQQTLMSGGT